MTRILNETLDYHDLVNMVIPILTVDKYKAKVGSDDEIATLTFTVKGKQVGDDLVDWLERGYDYIIDAQLSDGEVSPGKYLVFVEMDRRTKVPERIVEIIEDMVTLTDLPLKEWTIIVDEEDYDADVEILKSKIILSPKEYRQIKETELNEMRELSGLHPQTLYKDRDNLLKDFISKAGL